MHRLTFLSLLAFTSLAACGDGSGGERGDARFADATVDERQAAIQTGLGTPAAVALFAVFEAELAALDDAGCPVRTEIDGGVRYEADDCTATDGTRFDGRIVALNAPSFAAVVGGEDALDPAQPMEVSFEQWRSDDQLVDGVVWQSSPDPDAAYETTVDLRVDSAVAIDVEIDGSCAPDGDFVTCGADGFVIVDGFGSFGVTAEMRSASEAEESDEILGWLELRGADTLRVDFDAAADGCAPYAIDGEPAGEYCWETE